MDMLRHTRGGLKLWDVRKFTDVLEGYHTMLFMEHLGLNGLKCSFLRRLIMEAGVSTLGFMNALGGQDMRML